MLAGLWRWRTGAQDLRRGSAVPRCQLLFGERWWLNLDLRDGVPLPSESCRKGHRVRYYRTNRLLDELKLARADGSYPKLLGRLARFDLLILDDFLMIPPTEMQRRDLLEVLEDRYGSRLTLCTSQLPVDTWHVQLGDATVVAASEKTRLCGKERRRER